MNGKMVAVLALIAAAALLAMPVDAQAKGGRHEKGNSDGSGLFKPPSPITNPVFVMDSPPSRPKPATAELRTHLPKIAPPTGNAIGHEAAPTEEAAQAWPVHPLSSLSVPLLFR